MTTKIYEVRRKLYDSTNGLSLPRGAYVKTDEDLWVGRFGKNLKPASSVPNGTEPDVIEGTVEGSSEGEKKPPMEKKEAPKKEAPKVERVKVQKRGGNKAVLNNESKTK